MASLSDGGGLGRTAPDTTIALDKLRTIPFEPCKKGAGDPLADMRRVTRQLEAQTSTSGTDDGLAPINFGLGAGLPVTNVGRLLKLAGEHLGGGDFEAARAALEELLREQPRHPDGLLLLATCFHRLGQWLPGLRALAALRAAGRDVPPRVLSDANALRVELWDGIAPVAMEVNYNRLRNNDTAGLFADVDQLLAIDPLVWEFYYLRAEGQFAVGRADEAWDTVAAAIELVRTREVKKLKSPPGALTALRGRLLAHRARGWLRPALELYRKGKYADARAAVAAIDPEARVVPLAATFDAYLGRLVGPPAVGPQKAPPEGTPVEVDDLYFFIAGDDIEVARKLMSGGRYGPANDTLRAALPHAPHFAYLRFLIALTAYDALFVRFQEPNFPDLDEINRIVTDAHGHATAGADDPENPAAADLLAALDGLREAVAEALAERKRYQKDMKVFEPCFQEFDAILKSAGSGGGDVQALDRIQHRLTQLRGRVAGLPAMTSKACQADRPALAKAIDDILAEVENIRASIREVERINPLWQRLEKLVTGAKYSMTPLHTLAAQLAAVATEAKKLRPTLTTEKGRESVDELVRTVRTILTQAGYGHLV